MTYNVRCMSVVAYGTLGNEWRHGDPGGSSYVTRCGKVPDYDGVLCKECNADEIAEWGKRITTGKDQ